VEGEVPQSVRCLLQRKQVRIGKVKRVAQKTDRVVVLVVADTEEVNPLADSGG